MMTTPEDVLAGVRRDGLKWPHDVERLLAVVDALLAVHVVKPLYAPSDNGECGCPQPNEHSSVADDVIYEGDHSEGHGPEGFGIVCKKKIVGHWCEGCADIAVEHGCFEVPKDYPPEKCPVRSIVTGVLADGARI